MINRKKKKQPEDGDEGRVLRDISVDHLALVDRAANRRRFSVIKSASGESLGELIKALCEGDDELAKVTTERIEKANFDGQAEDFLEAVSTLKEYLAGNMPGCLADALQVVLGAAPSLQKGRVSPVKKFADGGALDGLFVSLALNSRNPRMIEAMLKGASAGELKREAIDEELDAMLANEPSRGISKAAPGQEESVIEDGESENRWPSL